MIYARSSLDSIGLLVMHGVNLLCSELAIATSITLLPPSLYIENPFMPPASKQTAQNSELYLLDSSCKLFVIILKALDRGAYI